MKKKNYLNITKEWLANTFGYKVKLLPRINVPDGIKTADYFFKDKLWNLKEINGCSKYSFGHAVEGKMKQANNFIFDITKSKLSKKDIYVQLNLLFTSKHTSWISKVIIKDNKKILGVYKKRDDLSARAPRPISLTRLYNYL